MNEPAVAWNQGGLEKSNCAKPNRTPNEDHGGGALGWKGSTSAVSKPKARTKDKPPQLHPKRAADRDLKRPKVVNKDMGKLVQEAWDHGAHCVASGKNHVKVWPPDGGEMISIPSTPSSPSQTYRNKLRALRRAGLAD